MSTLNPAFAFTVRPVHFDLSERGAGGRTIRMWLQNGEYHVSAAHARFKDEHRAWEHAVAAFPDLLDLLQRSEKLDWRAYGLRGEMMLKLGKVRFEAMQADFEKDVVGIFEQALHALDAIKLTKKATPMVTRLSRTRGMSWMEVRASVRLPYEAAPVTVAMRCIPSPVEEKTWSVRLRVTSTSDNSIAETQARFEELVRNLSYRGITVKDVQNGTYMDL